MSNEWADEILICEHLTRKLPLILGHEVAVGLHGDDVTGVMPLVRPHDAIRERHDQLVEAVPIGVDDHRGFDVGWNSLTEDCK